MRSCSESEEVALRRGKKQRCFALHASQILIGNRFEDVRFFSSVGVIFTLAGILHFVEILAVNGLPSRVLDVFLTFFLYIWFTVFDQWVSRARRATFNEQNLLLTYQPRALTHGHLFIPDPMTPFFTSKPVGESCTNSEFRDARDAHYKDEFNRAMNMSTQVNLIPPEEIQSMRIEFEQTSSPASSPNKSDKSPSFF